MATTQIATEIRSALDAYTAKWTTEYIDPIVAHMELRRSLGQTANRYDDYISTAITSGGYRRDTTRPYGEAVAENTAYALQMADELHYQGLIDINRTLDAVALGKVAPWKQSDYLTFFFMMMTRPDLDGDYTMSGAEVLRTALRSHNTANMQVFNDESLTNEQRFPEYEKFVENFLGVIERYEITPIGRMVRVLDWDRTMGSRAEESLARRLGIQVVTPMIITSTHDVSTIPVSAKLRERMLQLDSLGAKTLAVQPPALMLV